MGTFMTHDQVIIFDTTLRDGEQSPGASMNLEEKLRMPQVLEEMGVDVIEAGFPIASQRRFRGGAGGSREPSRGPTVCGLARATKGDIDRCAEAIRPAAPRPHPHLHLHPPLHMKYKLQMEPDAVLDSGHRQRSPMPAIWSTTSNGRPRTARAPSTTSCAAASRRRSPPGRAPSTSPTPSATPFPTNTPR